MKKKIIIVIPAFNEEEILEKNILDLYFFLQKKMKRYNWKVIISDNASSDKTLKIAKNLAHHYPKIGVVHREERPMSSAIKKSWEEYEADIYSYMDADLSADIHQFPLLIKAIEEGYDISIG